MSNENKLNIVVRTENGDWIEIDGDDLKITFSKIFFEDLPVKELPVSYDSINPPEFVYANFYLNDFEYNTSLDIYLDDVLDEYGKNHQEMADVRKNEHDFNILDAYINEKLPDVLKECGSYLVEKAREDVYDNTDALYNAIEIYNFETNP